MHVPYPPESLVSVDGVHHPDGLFPMSWRDSGLARGHGVFETLPVFDGRPVALEEHLQRLHQSCLLMRMPAPDLTAVAARIDTLLSAPLPSRGVLRIQITHGGRQIIGVRPAHPRPDALRAKRIIWPTPPFPPARAKHTSRAGYSLAPSAYNVDEVVRVTPGGLALEGTWSSVFCFRGGTLYTCPDDGRILPGITRSRVLSLARDVPLPVVEQAPGPPQPGDSWFLTSSLQGVVRVGCLDDIAQPPLAEPVRALRKALDAHTGRSTAQSH